MPPAWAIQSPAANSFLWSLAIQDTKEHDAMKMVYQDHGLSRTVSRANLDCRNLLVLPAYSMCLPRPDGDDKTGPEPAVLQWDCLRGCRWRQAPSFALRARNILHTFHPSSAIPVPFPRIRADICRHTKPTICGLQASKERSISSSVICQLPFLCFLPLHTRSLVL